MPIEATAAVLRSSAEPPRLEQVILRDPGPGEVLVQVTAAGVCHTDLAYVDGEIRPQLPVVLGHEGSGVVERLGPRVDGVREGDRVVLNLAPGCGACRECFLGHPIHCARLSGAQWALPSGPSPISGADGNPIAVFAAASCFATYAIVAERTAVRIPDSVTDDVAAIIGCAVITGFGAATAATDVRAGSRGAVLGAGGIGVSAIMGAQIRGAAEIVVIEPSAERRAGALRFGATSALDPQDESAIEALSTGDPLDWAIVCTGQPDAVRMATTLLGRRGAVTMVGLIPSDLSVDLDWLDIVESEKTIRGSTYGSRPAEILIGEILSLYVSGRLPLGDLITHRLPLSEIELAFAIVRSAEGIRTILDLTS